jgi:hypothetical protein
VSNRLVFDPIAEKHVPMEDPRDGYVTDPNAVRFFEGILALTEAYLAQETRWQGYAEQIEMGDEAIVEHGNNGALYLEDLRYLCHEALGLGKWAV